MNINRNKLYIISVLAFAFAIFKYLVPTIHITGNYMVLESLSFVIFLLLIYSFDKQLVLHKKELASHKLHIDELKESYTKEIQRLNDKIEFLQKDQNQASADEVKLNDIRKDLRSVFNNNSNKYKSILSILAKHHEIGIGLYYEKHKPSDNFIVQAHYGLSDEVTINPFIEGDGINGQAIQDKKPIVLKDIDQDYLEIESGSGSSKPKYLYLLPIIKEEEVLGLIELASFSDIGIERYWESINDLI